MAPQIPHCRLIGEVRAGGIESAPAGCRRDQHRAIAAQIGESLRTPPKERDSLNGLLPTNLPLFPGGRQLPVALRVDLLLAGGSDLSACSGLGRLHFCFPTAYAVYFLAPRAEWDEAHGPGRDVVAE